MLGLTRDTERLHSFYAVLPVYIQGWTRPLTGQIFFLPQSALLSCLRLEPAAVESCVCSAWGLNLLLLPSSFICSFLMPPVCLIWHYKKAFLHLLIPPLVLNKKSPRWLSFTSCVLESAPAAVEASFLQAHEFQSRFPFVLREQTSPQDVKRQTSTLYILKRKVNKQKWWCVQHQWHRKPKALVKKKKISFSIEIRSTDRIEANRFCPAAFSKNFLKVKPYISSSRNVSCNVVAVCPRRLWSTWNVAGPSWDVLSLENTGQSMKSLHRKDECIYIINPFFIPMTCEMKTFWPYWIK